MVEQPRRGAGLVDYAPLYSTVTAEELAAYRPKTVDRWEGVGIGAVFFIIVGVLFQVVVMLVQIVGHDNTEELAIGWLLLVPWLLLWSTLYLLSKVSGKRGWRGRIRLKRFADANDMLCEFDVHAPEYPGARFHPGWRHTYEERLAPRSGRQVEIGNYEAVSNTGGRSGNSSDTFGFIAIRLDTMLPHMRLVPGRHRASEFIDTDRQVRALKLEGDFADHFTLFVPEDYEGDALYVFTPDLMALLLDNATKLSVEIIDDWMLVTSPWRFKLTREPVLRRILSIVDVVVPKVVKQTHLYRDEHEGAAPGRVARIGQRIQNGSTRGEFIAIAVFFFLPIPAFILWGLLSR